MTYLKGKDLKQQGDCLVHCFTKKIQMITGYIEYGNHLWTSDTKPEDFDKW